MNALTIRDVQKLSARTIRALPGRVLITSGGKPVAELVPFRDDSEDEKRAAAWSAANELVLLMRKRIAADPAAEEAAIARAEAGDAEFGFKAIDRTIYDAAKMNEIAEESRVARASAI